MIDYWKNIIASQFEACLCMLHHCICVCPTEHWESKVGHGTFRQIAWHTLYHVDLYLSRSAGTYEQTRDTRWKQGERLGAETCQGLTQAETLEYLLFCRKKAKEILATETGETLQSPAGFDWLSLTRGELHLYNIRHVQHHTGQLSAFVRKITGCRDDWWLIQVGGI